MGLQVDIDKIAEKNRKVNGHRKQGFLVNDGDKLTKAERISRQEHNKTVYGLSEPQIAEMTKMLPPPSECQIFDIQKITHSK